MTLVPITEFDVVFISYDEPNADENWTKLLDLCPWAIRSHGIYGSDAAHKAAANLAETNRFITVDADNVVDPEFFNIELDMDKLGKDDVVSWASKNAINGLTYGNGGLKLWPKHVVKNMRTHESAPENNKQAQVDFCWNINYRQMNNVYSTTYANGDPRQAWRAGFREGVKMALVNGDRVSVLSNVQPVNLRKLNVWHNIGASATHGLWSIYGARLGTSMILDRSHEWDWRDVRDFEWLNAYWHDEIWPSYNMTSNPVFQQEMLKEDIRKIGRELCRYPELTIMNPTNKLDDFFRATYTNPVRTNPLTQEDEIKDKIDG